MVDRPHAHNLPESYALYLWHEDRPLEPAEDSILDRLVEDANLAGVARISLAATRAAFQKTFPGISVVDRELFWQGAGGSFRISFILDERNDPIVIRISSTEPLSENPELFGRAVAAAREAGCTLFQSAIE